MAQTETKYYFVVWLYYDIVNEFPVLKTINNVVAIPPGTISPRQWVIAKRRNIPTATYMYDREIDKEEYLSLREVLPT